ncbi:hypothetical protein ABPG72_004601 [Tetrahymena utriculariae]
MISMKSFFHQIFIILTINYQILNAQFLSNRSLGNQQAVILSETNYGDCYDFTTDNLYENKWALFQISSKSIIFYPDCVGQCGQFGSILGPFSSSNGLQRIIQVSKPHTKVMIEATFVQIDGWSLGQQFIMTIDQQIVYTWEYYGADIFDVNQCDVVLNGIQDHLQSFKITVPHTTNTINVSVYTIDSNSELVNMWGLKNFSVSTDICQTGVNSCQDISPLQFIINTQSFNQPMIKPIIEIQFNRPLTSGIIYSDISIQIDQIDSQFYSYSVSQIDNKYQTFYINFDQINFSTYYGQQMTITILKQVKDQNGMALQQQSVQSAMPSYYNYPNSDIDMISTIKKVTQGFATTLIISTVILTFGFDKFNWLLYSTDIGQILYLSTFINVKFPQNVEQVLFDGCSVFHLQGLSEIFQKMISNSTLQQQQPYFQRFQDLGINSLFLLNAGNLIAFIAVFLIFFSIIQLLSSFKLIKNQRVKSLLQSYLDKRVKWRLFFSLAYFLQAQILFAALIQIFTWSANSFSEIISYILSFISILFGFLLPIGMYRLISKNMAKILDDSLDETFTQKNGIAWQDLKKPEKNGSKKTIFFHFFLLLRRSLYACIVVFFQFNANLQIALLNICNVSIIFVVIFQMPFTKRRSNYKIIITEFILVCEYMVIQSYQNEQENEQSRISRGWIVAFAAVFIVFLQIFFLLIDVFEPLITYLKDFYIKLQEAKLQEAPLEEDFEKQKLKAVDEEVDLKMKQSNLLNELNHENQQIEKAKIPLSKSGIAQNNIPTPKIVNRSDQKGTSEVSNSRLKKSKLFIGTVAKNGSQLQKPALRQSDGVIPQLSLNLINTPPNLANQSDLLVSSQKYFESNRSIKLKNNQPPANSNFTSNFNNNLPHQNNVLNTSNNNMSINQIDYNQEIALKDDYSNIENIQKLDTQNEQNSIQIKMSPKKIFKHQQSYNSVNSSSFQQLDGSYYMPQLQNYDQISTKISNRQTIAETFNNSNLFIQQKLSYEDDNSLNKSNSPHKSSLSFQGFKMKSDSEIPQVNRRNSRNLSVKVQQQLISPETYKRNSTEEAEEEQDDQSPLKLRFFSKMVKSNQTIQEQPGEENGSIMGQSQVQIISLNESPIDLVSLQSKKLFPLLRNFPRHQSRIIQREFTNIEEENEESNQNSNSIIIHDGVSSRDIQYTDELTNKSKKAQEVIKKYGFPSPDETLHVNNENENPRQTFNRQNDRKKSQFAKYNSENSIQDEATQVGITPQQLSSAEINEQKPNAIEQKEVKVTQVGITPQQLSSAEINEHKPNAIEQKEVKVTQVGIAPQQLSSAEINEHKPNAIEQKEVNEEQQENLNKNQYDIRIKIEQDSPTKVQAN